jgi:ATP-binding cassette subfamily B multidrug efflux pump
MNMRRDVFQKLLSLPISYFDKTAVGTNTTRTVNDLETVNSVFSEGLITIIADILALVMLLIVMFYTSVKLTLICLVSFPLLLVASYIFKEKVKASFTKVRNEVAKLNAFLQENISGMSIIQMFNAEERSKQKFNDINKQYTQANIDAIFHYAVFFPVVEIISAASLGFMVWWGAKGVLHHEVSIGQLVAFPMFLNRLFQPIRQLADKFNTLQMGIIAGERVLDLINNEKSEIDDGKIIDQSLKADIEFNNVFFEYQKDLLCLKKYQL